jgi:anti-anti-sigma factor
MAEATIAAEDLPSSAGSQAVLFTISGQLDESNVDEKAKEVYKVLEEKPGKLNLIFDIAGLEYMNSKSIGYLTDWYGKIKERGGEVAIARPKANISDILQVVGLNQLIKTYESVDEAKQALLAGATPEAAETPAVEAAPAVEAPTEPPVVAPEAAPAEEAPEVAPPAPAEPEPVAEVPVEPEVKPEAPAVEPEAPAEAPEVTPPAPAEPVPVAEAPAVEPEAAPAVEAPTETPAAPTEPKSESTGTYDL